MPPKPTRFFNRELSWLAFNQRVLDEAFDAGVPLLERVKFLAITGSNLDEFFMVRVGGLELLVKRGARKRDDAGMTPRQQLDAVTRRVRLMVADQYRCYRDELTPALQEAGILHLTTEQLDDHQVQHLAHVFDEDFCTRLTPMGLSEEGTQPLLANLRLHVIVRMAAREGRDGPRFGVIPLAPGLPRFVSVPGTGPSHAFVMIEDVIRCFASKLFPGETIEECATFRLARNADLIAREDFAANFLTEMEAVLARRQESDCVRLEVSHRMSRATLSFLRERLDALPRHTYRIPGPIDLAAYFGLAGLDGFEPLKYEPWEPQPCPDIPPGVSMFDVLRDKEVLLSHPYDSYEPVVRLIEQAADDPDVLAIKQILYRTSSNSPIIAALQRAAEAGKSVAVMVELKARFDEARNIVWARALERAGAQVIYGVRGYKTHAKLLLIVRREAQGIVRYLHVGTGNYNDKTARLYSDLSYMTRDPELATEASAFFNAIAGHSEPMHYRRILAAPFTLKSTLLELIASEAERSRQGQKAVIMAKMNSLVDREIIKALYKASQDGVTIRLNIRGICTLKPGVKGLSETIEVVSIVDRFLEHSRVFYFRQGGPGAIYIGSADWMPRNLDRRVELVVPVDRPALKRVLVDMLKTYFRDNVKSNRLRPDGSYERLQPANRRRAVRSQEVLYREACAAAQDVRRSRRTTFEPYRAPKDNA